MTGEIHINDVEKFLTYMFEGQRGHVELMFMGTDRIPNVKSYALYDPTWIRYATNRVNKLRHFENCYFGVCPRKESVERHATENQVIDVPHLWVDIDGKMLEVSLDEQLEKIMALEVKPTLVIMSGNGYHCYWRLRETYHVKDLDCKAYIKGILKGLSIAVDGDNTFNLDRVLRIPFTFNRKDSKNIKDVKIVHFDPSIVYDLATFEPYKVEIDVEELEADEVAKKFQPIKLEDMNEHKDLVQLAKERLEPHIRKLQVREQWPEVYIGVIVSNLANGIIDYVVEGTVEADIDLEDNMFILHMDEENFKRLPLERDAMKVIRHMNKLRMKTVTKDHINLNDLPFSLRVRIMNGTLRGGRSELDYKIISELRSLGYTPLAIKKIYDNEKFRIGDKYRERQQSRHNYLMSIIKSVDKKLENA